MGREYTEISDRLQEWISKQQVFFVATAPLSADGLINCSPKGLDSFRVLGPKSLAYVDVGGSGIETVAHLNENGRILIMMCAFEGTPKIFRFYGTGNVVESHDARFADLLARFPEQPSARNIIEVSVVRIIDSCGYGVPLYDFKKHRDSFDNYYGNKTDEEIAAYRRNRNATALMDCPDFHSPINS